MKLTHWGWFLFCPVYLNPDDYECCLKPVGNQEWLLWLATEVQQCLNWAISFINPEAAGFIIMVQGKLKKPIKITFPINK